MKLISTPPRQCIICKKWYERKPRTQISQFIKSKFCSYKCRGVWQTEKFHDSGNPNWKGNQVQYHALHRWVKKHLGSPKKCEHCEFESDNPYRLHWANKSRKYKRDKKDWIRLCLPCHWKYDGRTKS